MIAELPPEMLVTAGIAIVGSGGAAWATASANTRATNRRVDRLEHRWDNEIPEIRDTMQRIDVRTARMEERLIAQEND